MYDNKGNSVKKYEPFLSSTHEYEEEDDLVQWGVTPILHYDPLGRLVRTEFPDGTESRVVFDAWYQETWDQNDCVTGSRWLTERLATGAPADERTAAVQTQDHADTPSVAYFDSLGRAYLTVEDNGTHGSYETRMAFDIEGNIRSVIDQRGITAFTYKYDIAGTQVYTNNPDAGERWIFTDTAGNPIRTWDSRGHVQRFTYDVLRRATHTYVQQGANPEHLMIRTVYGELLSDPLTGNHRGKVYQVFDGAGVLTNDTYDFKGNLLSSTRHIATEYHQTPNWDVIDGLTDVNAIWTAAQSSLQSQNYSTSIEYDALNRVVRSTTPDSSITVPHYNEANLLDSVEVYIRGAANPTQYVTNIDYNARGQRVLVSYGNGTTTTYDYDPYTFRLSQLQSIRSSDNQVLQDNAYTYDPVGNIISIRDNADWDHLFAREPVSGDGEYVYDPIYRLIQASGREHPGQQPTNADSYLGAIPHPNDTNALIRYTENYSYDQNGNILSMQHIAGAGSWTRDYQYGATGNRLLATSAQGDPPGTFSHTYSYNPHGSMVSMPHLSVIDWDYAERMQHTNLGGGGDVYFTYDATGQRIRKIYEHSGIVEERIYSGGWEIYRRRRNSTLELERETLHVMDGTRKVALIETKTVDTSNPASVPQTRTRYQLDNHLGSASLELDSSSNVISYEEYHPFGTSSFRSADSVAEVSAKRYRYTGKERDDETGLYYYGARYYASWLGRWLSCDPLINDGWNLYVYVRNSPVRFNDPDGRIVSSGALAEGYKSLKNEFKDGYSGIVFTAQAGFVDLSHAKDYADKFLKIHSAIEKSEKGTILLESTVPYVKNAFKRDIGHKKVIREFVYDFSKDKNTIESSYKLLYKAAYIEEKDQGEYGDYSSKVFTSFSYEDITSDMVGGLIGEEIIKLKGLDREMEFDTLLQKAFKNTLEKLGIVETEKTAQRIRDIEGNLSLSKSGVGRTINEKLYGAEQKGSEFRGKVIDKEMKNKNLEFDKKWEQIKKNSNHSNLPTNITTKVIKIED